MLVWIGTFAFAFRLASSSRLDESATNLLHIESNTTEPTLNDKCELVWPAGSSKPAKPPKFWHDAEGQGYPHCMGYHGELCEMCLNMRDRDHGRDAGPCQQVMEFEDKMKWAINNKKRWWVVGAAATGASVVGASADLKAHLDTLKTAKETAEAVAKVATETAVVLDAPNVLHEAGEACNETIESIEEGHWISMKTLKGSVAGANMLVLAVTMVAVGTGGTAALAAPALVGIHAGMSAVNVAMLGPSAKEAFFDDPNELKEFVIEMAFFCYHADIKPAPQVDDYSQWFDPDDMAAFYPH